MDAASLTCPEFVAAGPRAETLLGGSTINDETTFRHQRKYESKNPLQQWLLGRFHRQVWRWLCGMQPSRVLDFGCGEGYFWSSLAHFGPLPDVTGIDLRSDAIAAARRKLPEQTFLCEDLFTFEPSATFDLVVASEILEHLHDPARYLRRLCELSHGELLLTVPHEPWFRLCNLARGRDLARWGNHPEHVQQWSQRGFVQFASQLLQVDECVTSFPFLLLRGRPRLRGSAKQSVRRAA